MLTINMAGLARHLESSDSSMNMGNCLKSIQTRIWDIEDPYVRDFGEQIKAGPDRYIDITIGSERSIAFDAQEVQVRTPEAKLYASLRLRSVVWSYL